VLEVALLPFVDAAVSVFVSRESAAPIMSGARVDSEEGGRETVELRSLTMCLLLKDEESDWRAHQISLCFDDFTVIVF
jgi:hypothetical protein